MSTQQTFDIERHTVTFDHDDRHHSRFTIESGSQYDSRKRNIKIQFNKKLADKAATTFYLLIHSVLSGRYEQVRAEFDAGDQATRQRLDRAHRRLMERAEVIDELDKAINPQMYLTNDHLWPFYCVFDTFNDHIRARVYNWGVQTEQQYHSSDMLKVITLNDEDSGHLWKQYLMFVADLPNISAADKIVHMTVPVEGSSKRFDLGERAIIMRYVYEEGKQPISFFRAPTYVPWENDVVLKEIEMLEVTCKSRHAVCCLSDDPEHTGFIFEDTDGRPWHNQYPTAAYGQLDDSNDRRMHRGDVNPNSPEEDFENWETLEVRLSHVYQGVRQIGERVVNTIYSEADRKNFGQQRQMLIDLANRLIAQAEKQFPVKVSVGVHPWWGRKPGEEEPTIYNSMVKVDLKWQDQPHTGTEA